MNESSWIAMGGTFLIQILLGAFVYGQLTQRVKGHEHTLLRHDKELEGHTATLLNHQGRISRVEGRLRIDDDE